MIKCPASENGVCRNVIGFGTLCSGYSDKCSLKPHYDNLQRLADGETKAIKESFGIKGGKE
ncbi:MAG: hypothetical protein NC548_54185 [Lachnospiraceae bacterium]|nr:hypothetical protein [Lachnospiraceae bacterium]